MHKHHTSEEGYKYRADYEWPEPGSERECPRFKHTLELQENKSTYFGKPWWCYKCQWQFSEDDFPEMECESKEDK